MMRKRYLLEIGGILAASTLLTGCIATANGPTSGDNADDKSLTVLISGGDNIATLWEEHLVPAFEEANPGYSVKVTLDLHGERDAQNLAKMASATEQGKDPGFDLVDGGVTLTAAEAKLLTPVTAQMVSALDDIPADVVTAGGNGGIPYRGSVVFLAYDTNVIPTPPKTLDDLLAWIKDNPGKFTYNSPKSGGSGGAFVTTVLDKYVPEADRKKMAVGYEKDLQSLWDEGFATLRDLNPYVFQNGVYPNGNQLILDMLASGQISMAPVWSDMFIDGKNKGSIPESVSYTQISNPSFTGGAAYLGIPSSSPRQEGALKLVNFVLTPEAQAMIVREIAGFPAISLNKLPADIQEELKDADTNNLRQGYFAGMTQDLNNLWDQKVPG